MCSECGWGFPDPLRGIGWVAIGPGGADLAPSGGLLLRGSQLWVIHLSVSGDDSSDGKALAQARECDDKGR